VLPRVDGAVAPTPPLQLAASPRVSAPARWWTSSRAGAFSGEPATGRLSPACFHFPSLEAPCQAPHMGGRRVDVPSGIPASLRVMGGNGVTL
jgi:hypothetical protein